MRSDPTDTGGLFVGRRPGTAPVRFRAAPVTGGGRRRRVDELLSGSLLAGIVVLCLCCWGPIPLACLWLGSRADYLSGSVSLGLLVSFAALFAFLFGVLALLRRVDGAWLLVRRAAGHDQRSGALGRIFAASAAAFAVGFAVWFFVIHGPGYGAPDLRVP
jgi:hypothetical protein